MIITHASYQQITEVSDDRGDYHRGCLFFAAKGNTYNLANNCVYQYDLNIDKERVLSVNVLFSRYSKKNEIVFDVAESLASDLGLEWEDKEVVNQAIDLLSEEKSVEDFGLRGEMQWLVQQYQGILADELGYDCFESTDEQGAVYIAYCVDRKLTEIKVK